MSLSHVSAYLLANVAGTEHPTTAQVMAILVAAGVAADKAEVEKLVSQLNGKNIAEAISSGRSKLFSFTAAASVAVAAGSPKKGAAAPVAAVEAPKEEEEDEGAGFDLFD